MRTSEKLARLKAIAEGRGNLDTTPQAYIIDHVLGSDIYYINGVPYLEPDYQALMDYNRENGIIVPTILGIKDYGKFKTREAYEAYLQKESYAKRKRLKVEEERKEREFLNKPQEQSKPPVVVEIKEKAKEPEIPTPKVQEIPSSGLMSEYGIKWKLTNDHRPLHN